MEDPQERLFHLVREQAGAGDDGSPGSRNRGLRRMMVLLATSCLAFGLTALWLSRLAAQTSTRGADSQAVKVVEAHFAALHRGDFRAAYALFSTHLRREMSFQEFHEIMEAHLPLLRGKVSVFPETITAGRVVVDIAFRGTNPADLTAVFTLVQSGGRWWIDAIHWDIERPRPQRLIRA
ncbi:MAG TPA: DUF4864 domain-containing protein [Patescibacteria group bacterium]|nr:DUF4864 domain-containing protein [Patescibacteria group bacterium]